MRRGVLIGVALAAGAAHAERDAFGLGDGHDGALTIAGAQTINTSAALLSAATPGALMLQVGTSGYAAGQLLLLVQVGGAAAGDSGTPGPYDLSAAAVGRWELARIANVAGANVTLTAPLEGAFAAQVTLVTDVPEYTDVTVTPGTVVSAAPWDGASGGVIAFLATGTVSNAGAISADGLGFRGGLPVNDPAGSYNCLDLDEVAPLGAQRGEGIALGGYGPMSTGFGNVLNGGGGGNCHNAGGGGGGNASRGGTGGVAYDGPVVGGLGGGALECGTTHCLTFGGGGGTSHQHAMGAGPGGLGGGIVFMRAQGLTGNGSISANGTCGGQSHHDGSGGGGAGGTLYLRFSDTVAASTLSARGGDGGSIWDYDVGRPGGAGGAGRVFLQGAGTLPTAVATSGLCGLSPTPVSARCPTDFSCGAEPDLNTAPFSGTIDVLSSGLVVPTVSLTISPSTASSQPPLTGLATPGAAVDLELDGAALAPVTADAQGMFSTMPPMPLSDGQHHVRGRAQWQELYGPWSADAPFIIGQVVIPSPPSPPPKTFAVSCSVAPGLAALLGVAALLLRRRRRVRP